MADLLARGICEDAPITLLISLSPILKSERKYRSLLPKQPINKIYDLIYSLMIFNKLSSFKRFLNWANEFLKNLK